MAIQRTHGFFFTELLNHLELPVRAAGLRALACVSIFESSQGNERWFNPLACEQAWPNATMYNSAGVRRYATIWDGVHASAQMYSGSAWAGVRAELQAATYRTSILRAFNAVYQGWAKVDFTSLEFNTVADLEQRLAHVLR